MPAGTVLGAILAGGRSRRMGGGDKGLRLLGGRPLLAHVIDRLRPQVGALAICTYGDPARFAGFGVPVVTDTVPGQAGPLAGLLAGLDWAAEAGAEAIVSAPADTPFLPADLVARLAAAGPLAVAEADGLHPTCGLWPVALRMRLRTALAAGERRIGGWAMAEGAVVVAFPDAAAFFNVNTPGDMAAAERLLAAGG